MGHLESTTHRCAPRPRLGIERLEARVLLSTDVARTLPPPPPILAWIGSQVVGSLELESPPVLAVSPERKPALPDLPDVPADEVPPAEVVPGRWPEAIAIEPPEWLIDLVELRGDAAPPPPLPAPPDLASLPEELEAAIVEWRPEAGAVHIEGRLTPAERAALFQVPITAETVAVWIDVERPGGPGPALDASEAFWLQDSKGDVLGRWSMPKAGDGVSVVVRAPAREPGQVAGLTLGVALEGADPAAGPLAPPADYAISIRREDRPTEGGETPSAGESPSLDPPPWTPAPRVEPSGSGGLAVVVVDAAVGLGPAASGALPMRGAGPSNPGDEPVAPPVGRLDGTVVDLSLLDLAASSAVVAPEGRGLGVLAAGGAFPLVAATRLVEPPPAVDGPLLAVAPTVEEVRSIASANVNEARRGDRAPRRGVPLTAGLVAAALAVGLLLPEVVVGLAPVVRRRPLPWSKGHRRPRRAGPFDGTGG